MAVSVITTAGCGGISLAATEQPIKVVATTSLLADLVNNVGRTRVDVHSIVPPGADVHSFQPTPQDSIEISQARLIVSNGSGLDDFLMPTVNSAAGAEAVRLVASQGLAAQLGDGAVHRRNASATLAKPNQERRDPHFWQNPVHTIHYVERIRDGLIQADPDHAEAYKSNAAEYIDALQELDQEIERVLNRVPIRFRHLVTFHDAFGHFADRYGWQTTALVANDAGAVTPGTVVSLMKRLHEEEIPAVFAEPQFRSPVIVRAAEDAGISIGLLYSDVLDDGAATYLDMMRFNANSLVKHLAGQ
ncbi:MAG: zinc ABC transporter substrate-binding protein [Chloroflexi bacterium]|nr:zinc ABC transporter substrate-binding protein [Chloroflexota bacterium]